MKAGEKNCSSIITLSKYIKTNEDGSVNANGIISQECFSEWLSTKAKLPQFPQHAFRKIVSGHCRGDVGLIPFKQNEEKEVLKVLRKKKIWPCFNKTKCRIGLRGFQKSGYWENKRRKAIEIKNLEKITREKHEAVLRQLSFECDYYRKLLISLKQQYLSLLN